MKTIFDKNTLEEILNRIDRLMPETKAVWGKMNSSQMMAHCAATVEVASGKKKHPRSLLGKILGPFFKGAYIGEKPFSKNSPTDPNFIIRDEKKFESEKFNLIKLVKQFSEGGEAMATKYPHSFFGHLTPKQWGETQYKHFDHHLSQFGV